MNGLSHCVLVKLRSAVSEERDFPSYVHATFCSDPNFPGQETGFSEVSATISFG